MAFLQGWQVKQEKKIYELVWSIMANRAGFAALFFKLWNPKSKILADSPRRRRFGLSGKRMGLAKIFIGGLFKKVFTKADYVQAISNYLADWAKKNGGGRHRLKWCRTEWMEKIKSKILKTKK